MKKLILFTVSAFLILSLSFCDKVENPYQNQATLENIELDTTLYPGVWQEYMDNEYPDFPENTNTDINVLIEDYTGHKCNNCPEAATIAHDIHENNPERVFVASIHTDPGAQNSFQSSNPEATSYYTDHTNPDSDAYGEEFQNGYNFIGNPQGTVNRKTIDEKMFDFSGTWQSRASDILNANDLKVNLQSAFNYYPSTNGGYLHVEAVKLTDEEITMNAVVYVIQDSLVDWQLMPDNSSNEFYLHRDKHLGSIDDNPFGIEIFPATTPSGEKITFDYSYSLPMGIDASNMHFLIYLYDVSNYEILQVIKQKVE
ncbi:MAG: Omp28-related outer membrane protein [Brumimicrobium sp.]